MFGLVNRKESQKRFLFLLSEYKKYEARLKVMRDELSRYFSLLRSDSFFGPYAFVRKIYLPPQMNQGDFCFAESNGRS